MSPVTRNRFQLQNISFEDDGASLSVANWTQWLPLLMLYF